MTDYLQFIDRGLTAEMIPIAPSKAEAENVHSLGKQPSVYDESRQLWVPFFKWANVDTTSNDLVTWANWPEHNIGMRCRYHPSIDIDIDHAPLAEWVCDLIDRMIGNTATRSRNDSPRCVRVMRLATGEPLQTKRKIILHNGAIEMLGDGQQVVVSGVHPSGASQKTTGEILVVTVQQINTLWKKLIEALGDQVKKVTGGGNSVPNKPDQQLIQYTDDTDLNLQAVEQYIKEQPLALEGERNDTCYKMVAHVRDHFALSKNKCLSVFEGYANLDAKEVKAVVSSVYRGNAQSQQGQHHPATVGFGGELPAGASREPIIIEHGETELKPSLPGTFYPMNQPLNSGEFDPLHCNSKFVPRATMQNFTKILEKYRIAVGYDQVSKSIMISGGNMSHGNDGSDNSNYANIYSVCCLNQFPTAFIDHGLSYLAENNQINPVADWIHSKKWDGVSRIGKLFNTLHLSSEQDRDVAYMMFRKWLIGTASIVQEKIKRFEYVLVLQSELGGEGKTAWFKSLCPTDWLTDGLILDTTDKDSVKRAVSHWIVELGELDSTFRKSDVKRLMAILSNDCDEIRLPYAKCANKFARRTSFGATVNCFNFLQDDSGDRRFWPISVKSVNYEHNIDMQQLWAEVDTLNENHWLDDKQNKTVIEYNKDFKSVDPVVEKIEAHLSLQSRGDIHLSATEVCQRAGINNVNKQDANKAAKYLRDKGYRNTKVRGKRGFRVPNVNAFLNT